MITAICTYSLLFVYLPSSKYNELKMKKRKMCETEEKQDEKS